MVVFLTIGIQPRAFRLSVLFLASGVVAGVVIRLPASWRTRTGLIATSFLAAIGVLPILAENPDPASNPPGAKTRINASYLAGLIRKGPFTEPLPGGMWVKGFEDVQIGDAGPRVDAVALELDWPPEYDPFRDYDGPNAHIEIYRSPSDAAKHADERITVLKKQYNGPVHGSRDGYFLFGNHETLAGGTRGHVYVEAYSFPDSNGHRPLATGTVNAMLNYAEKMGKIATEK
ncbi:hypothetical protein ABZ951_25505 [Streptomyces sp. NPDC046215]|uniref:Uncharacterized protein n=1 Tax=Streptomyces stramineus TaxID=173861 RepID=A0ABN0ZPJ1_9ACTN